MPGTSIAGVIRARPTLATLALTLLIGVLTTSLPAAPARAADDTTAPPLQVRLTGMTPSEIPEKGPITLTGTVSNTSEETWADINVHALTSPAPITDRQALDDAARTDPDSTYLGPRLTAPGTYVNVGDLPPGSTTTFEIRLKRNALLISGAPGVYWIGAQALGSNASGRDDLADGRARTFIPLVPHGDHAAVQLVVPIRQEVHRASDGSVLQPSRLAAMLGPNGRLGRLVSWAGTATGLPLSWVVDPAVLDAAANLADDNPKVDLGNGKPAPSPSSSPSASSNGAPPPPGLGQDARSEAGAWLRQTHDLIAHGNLYGLPFGDPDVSALSRREPALLERARALGSDVFNRQQLNATPAVAPPDGYLDPASLGPLSTGTTLLVGDHGRPASRTFWTSSGGQPLVLTDDRTSSGGPLPNPLTTLALRQRILADAALTAVSGARRPLVVMLPATWNPGASWNDTGFFSGLRVSWLHLRRLGRPGPASAPNPPTYDGLRYPASERRKEPSGRDLFAAHQLARTATVLDHLLDTRNDASRVLTGAALAATSYESRADRVFARVQVTNLNAAMRGQMDRVRVVGTPFVTLSGGSGSLNVSLVNDLDQPITVGLVAHTGNPKGRIDQLAPVAMAAGQRATLRLHATAGAIGVHEITLQPVTRQGDPLGTPFQFSLRTSQVGKYFWAVLVAGGLILVVAILRRIRLRIRSSRWRQ